MPTVVLKLFTGQGRTDWRTDGQSGDYMPLGSIITENNIRSLNNDECTFKWHY